MKRIALLAPFAAPLAWAQQPEPLLGTKQDAPSGPEPAPAVPGLDLVQPLVVCALILIAVKWAAPRLLKKASALGQTGSLGLTVHSSVPFGPGTLSVVSVEGRRLLVGSSPTAISLVADLTPSPGSAAAPDPPAFFELLDEARSATAEPGSTPAHHEPAPEGGLSRPQSGAEDGMSMDAALTLLREARSRIGAVPGDGSETGHATDRLERLLKG